MKNLKKSGAVLLLAVLLALSGCASMSPKNKTLLLSEPMETQAQEENTDPSEISFEIRKITRVSLEKVDPDGIHPDVSKAVVRWLDDENLFALSVQNDTSGTAAGETSVMTQFATINYQYGFYDPILTLVGVEAEGCALSPDGQHVACVVGNSLTVYDLTAGSLLQSVSREVLAPRVTFAENGNKVYFTSGGGSKRLEALDLLSGTVTTVLEGKTYRALAVSGGRELIEVVSQGAEEISYYENGTLYENLLTGGRTTTTILPDSGGALLCYDGNLYLLTAGKAEQVQENVLAFALAEDGTHMVYAVGDGANTSDIYLGYWSGNRILSGQLIYKGMNLNVDRLLLSEDMSKLYLQGMDAGGDVEAYTLEFR